MNNYNTALKITEEFSKFFDKHFKSLTSLDSYKITEYCSDIVIPTLQAKQVFNNDPNAAVGSCFLIPIERGRVVSGHIHYIEEHRYFGVDCVMVYDEIGVPLNDGVKSGWIEEYYKKDLYKISK